ncbi:MAG TPA: hypothetical protein PLK34_02855 [Candidatus Pacearchaeota archaeon]|nr:hypothetical protein [Candidatus Pacearchaeota archaeon]
MKNKNLIFSFVGLIFLFGIIFNSYFISAETLYCAEKTISGAWCQNVPFEKVDTNFQYAETSCQATYYCKTGTCVNSNEGVCSSNVPKKVCEQSKGVWDEKASKDIPLCNLGCCLLGNQAAFTTQTRCGKLSSDYNLNMTFRKDITNEAQCIASAYPLIRGACVSDSEFQKTCSLITKEECNKRIATASGGISVSFHEGLLCSAPSLGTNCLPSNRTTCVEDKEEVYLLDSCGNIANIYDSEKMNSPEYWETIQSGRESCELTYDNQGNPTNSDVCGNCNYLDGSTCKASQRTDSIKPEVGENICAPLNCEWKGKTYLHGESWCETTGEAGNENLVGSEHILMKCYDSEVLVEPCAAFRQEICSQSSINGFGVSSCVVNRWQDCISQTSQENCEDSDKRDCAWTEVSGIVNLSSSLIGLGNLTGGAACIPKYTPGLSFWKSDARAEQACSVASNYCVVKMKRGILGQLLKWDTWRCEQGMIDSLTGTDNNCECVTDQDYWKSEVNKLCSAVGDCGVTKNYLGTIGELSEIKVDKIQTGKDAETTAE